MRKAIYLLLFMICGCENLWGSQVKPDPLNCIQDPSICSDEEICNPRTEVCEARCGSGGDDCTSSPSGHACIQGRCGCNSASDCPAVPNAAAACTNRLCSVGSCSPGHCDWDKKFDNGCEGSIPTTCQHGVDPISGAAWVVCSADCSGARMSHFGAGSRWYSDAICKSVGYAASDGFGGNCGSICGNCNGTHSCMDLAYGPLDGNSQGCGVSDSNGFYICGTPQWGCKP